MTQTQKTRLVAVALAGVALISFLFLIKALMIFFHPRRPPIIISGGSIIIRTLGGNAWDHQASRYTTHQAVNPSSVQTTGTLDAQHVPYDLPGSGLQPNGWSITITTMAYHIQQGKQHNGQVTIRPAQGLVQINSPEGFTDAPPQIQRPHGKSFIDPLCVVGNWGCDFHMDAITVNGLTQNGPSKTLYCDGGTCTIEIY